MLKNIITFWPKFFKEGYYTYKYRKAARSIETELQKEGLRVDWLGRIYTVVNIKEEFQNQPDVVQQSIVFQQLSPVNKILLKYGMSDLAYPEISKIPNSAAYLVVLYPDNEYFILSRFLFNFIFLVSLATVIRLGINYAYLIL